MVMKHGEGFFGFYIKDKEGDFINVKEDGKEILVTVNGEYASLTAYDATLLAKWLADWIMKNG